MLAFIDASGDPGLKVLNNASRYFLVAMVTFDELDAMECDRQIQRLRGELKPNSGFEFHFSQNSRRIREAFLSVVSRSNFSYYIFAVNKRPDLLARIGITHSEALLNYAIRQTWESAEAHLGNAKVVIDGERSDRRFRDGLATYLRRQVRGTRGHGLIRKVSLESSRGNNLLQVADYVAGVNNRVLSGKSDGESLQRYLRGKQAVFQVWPEI